MTWTLKFSRCHWIEVLGLAEHYKRAEIDARIDSDGSITVAEPQNITRFAIYPPAVSGKGGSVTIAGDRIALPASESGAARPVVFEKRKGKLDLRWRLDSVTLTGKRPGLQGPIDDAFARPFLCVRGTGKAWNPAVGVLGRCKPESLCRRMASPLPRLPACQERHRSDRRRRCGIRI